ncbi:amidase [Kribbella kalugense]|uniref:Aspartyl-tRNA(Asn)/glutamyl-tRNA(Gln) amidotransferase subunit A n=1 Tax=Kribbella kalugense TaxID=2512221 RepID=A0A4R7ZYD8_9ACTN|nr:amidase [Kribbella kalugense]TDW23213.1 aspartyl-tRNA(Asn)/glutamyl-tRNA(Gln) amidotransferase subunit A [Kribbella kalugense]
MLPITIKDAAAALRDGSITSTALTQQILDKATALNPALGAYVEITTEAALDQAAAADAALAAGEDHGPLQGIPLAIKDIIALEGTPTTANSRVLAPDWNGGVDAPVVSRLRQAGAVFVGKATTSEFAIGLPDATKGFPVPHNPWNVEHTPAGSSSGTGIAVAAGLALGGLGTDTGGSVRGPAAVNGHTGLKVTFGRVPKSGVVPLGFSLDSIGPMARSAWDCAALLEVMAGYDVTDPNSAQQPVPAYTGLLDGSVDGLRIALPTSYFFDHEQLDPEMHDAVLSAVKQLVGLGASSSEVELAHAAEAKDANHIILVAEAYAYHRNNLVNRWTDYGVHTRPTLARGAFYNAGDIAQAERFRRYFARQVAALLDEYDVIITPAAPTPAERAAELTPSKRLQVPSFTGHWNLTGLPAVAVPVGFSTSGLPLSMQIIGKPFAEGTVLKVADALQRVSDWHLAVPPVGTLAA